MAITCYEKNYVKKILASGKDINDINFENLKKH